MIHFVGAGSGAPDLITVRGKDFQEYFGTSIEKIYGEVLEKYKKQGLLLEEDGRICLSRAGIHVSNAVMADFLL